MKSLFMVSVVATLFATGTALKCYECGTKSNGVCELDPFDPKNEAVGIEHCRQDQQTCVKAAVSLDSKLVSVTRGCMDIRELGMSKLTAEATVLFCDTDFCNGAHSTTAAATTSFAVALLFIIRNFY